MRCKIAESTSNPAISTMSVVSDCSQDRKIAQSRRHGFPAHIFSVSRSTNEMPVPGGGRHSWHPLRQQGLNRPGRRLPRRSSEISTELDAQLQEIGEKGGELQKLADDYSQARLEAQRVQAPTFKLCGKSGLLAGVTLATLSIGAFVCSRYPSGSAGTARPSTWLSKPLFESPVGADTAVRPPESLPVAAGIWAAKIANVSEVTQSDDVKIEKLDFSCLMQRETLTLADIFRQVGNTMLNPVTELAKELEVIDYYQNMGGCPNDENIRFLSEVTGKVDQVVSALISLIPGLTPVVIIQRVGGALFRVLADQMEGKSVNFYDVQAVNDQVMMIAKMIADFSPKNENGQPNENDFVFPEKTYLEEGNVIAWIDSAKYTITNKQGVFIAHGNKGEFPVNYSYKEKSWYLVENEGELTSLELSPLEDPNKVINLYSDRVDFEISDALRDVKPLAPDIFSELHPDYKGVYRYVKQKKRAVMRALKLNGNFYRVCSGTTKTRMAIYDKPELEMIFYDGTWYLASNDENIEIKSLSCWTKRSPSASCMSYSQDLEKILSANHDIGLSPLKFSWLKSDKSNPAILISENNKKYIQHGGVVFKAKVVPAMSSGLSGSKEIRIYGKKKMGFLKRKTDFYITSGYYSELKGNSFLYSRVESIMENLCLRRPTAEAWQQVKDFERSKGEITPEEYASIRAYGGVSYRDINDYIYNGRLNADYTNPELTATTISHIENIRGLLKKLPSIDGIVYRGSQLKPSGIKALSDLKAEDIISSRKFISASLDPEISNIFAAGPGAVRYTIYVKKAAHPILTYTGKLREAEVLIEDNTVFRCVYVYGRDIVLEEIVNPSAHDLRRLKNYYI